MVSKPILLVLLVLVSEYYLVRFHLVDKSMNVGKLGMLGTLTAFTSMFSRKPDIFACILLVTTVFPTF